MRDLDSVTDIKDVTNKEYVDSIVPPGCVMEYAAANAPSGWLLCDGTAVSRTTYSALFGVIGTTYGVGNGSTTFNLPNLRGRVPVGLDPGSGQNLGFTAGAPSVALTQAEMPPHTHSIADQGVSWPGPQGGIRQAKDWSGWGTGGNWVGGVTQTTSSAGSGAAHQNMPPYIILNFIIKI